MPACPVAAALTILNNPWKFLIVRSLSEGPLRFGELKTRVTGISPKVLSGSLADLQEAGILSRTVLPSSPPRAEYALTGLGREFLPVIGALARFGMAYKARFPEPEKKEEA